MMGAICREPAIKISNLHKAYDGANDGCELHFGTSRQHETRNKRSKSHDRSLLEQGPAHRAGEVRFRVTKGTFVGDKTGSVGHDETLRLNLGWFWHYDRPNRVPVGMDGLSREVSDTRLPFKK